MTTREGGVGVEEGEYAKLSEEQKKQIILLVKQKLAERGRSRGGGKAYCQDHEAGGKAEC